MIQFLLYTKHSAGITAYVRIVCLMRVDEIRVGGRKCNAEVCLLSACDYDLMYVSATKVFLGSIIASERTAAAGTPVTCTYFDAHQSCLCFC